MPQRLLKLVLFLTVLIAHLTSSNITSTDSRLVIPTAISIINEGNLDLNEFSNWIPNLSGSAEKIDDKLFNSYPLGESLIAVPFVYFLSKIFEENVVFNNATKVERFIASSIVAISALFVVEIMLLLGLNWSVAIFIALVFAFSTSAFSTASRAMWQHGPTMLAILIVIWLFHSSEKKKYLIQFTAIPVAFSFICRPTNGLFVMLVTGLVFFNYRQYFLKYLMWAVVLAVPFVLINYLNFHHIFSAYYRQPIGSANQNILNTATSLLISPNRGFFFWHPLFIFSVLEIYSRYTQKTLKPIERLMVIHFILFTLLISSFSCWWGSHCIGPRFFSDMIPYGIYFFGLFVKKIESSPLIFKNLIWSTILLLFVIGTFVHGWAANNAGNVTGSMEWNIYPQDIDLHTERVWDLQDAQFLRGTKWGKYSFLDLEKKRLSELNKNLVASDTLSFNSQYPFIQFTNGWWSAEEFSRYNQGRSSGLFFKPKPDILKKPKNVVSLKLKSITGSPIVLTINSFETRINPPANVDTEVQISLPKGCLTKDVNVILFQVDNTLNYNIFDTRELAFAFYYLIVN